MDCVGSRIRGQNESLREVDIIREPVEFADAVTFGGGIEVCARNGESTLRKRPREIRDKRATLFVLTERRAVGIHEFLVDGIAGVNAPVAPVRGGLTDRSDRDYSKHVEDSTDVSTAYFTGSEGDGTRGVIAIATGNTAIITRHKSFFIRVS